MSALFGLAHKSDIRQLLETHSAFVLAISAGSVFFGASTYIGNGPNLMVKAIADQQRFHAPDFELIVEGAS